MERKTSILLLIGATIFLVTATLSVLLAQEETLSPDSSNLETCKTLKYSGEDKQNLLFFADEKTTGSYAEYLLNSKPFREDNFNVYYIDSYQPSCSLYRNIALYCPSRELAEKSASCPHDFTIVIERKSPDIRSSAHLNVASINKALSKTVLLHEVGHLYGLDEEYSAGYNPGSKSPNCKNSCEGFSGSQSGCFQECSSSSYYRSVENGVMRTLSPDDESNPYGDFNSQFLESKIIKDQQSKLTALAISEDSSCSDESYILLEASYENGEVNILSKERRIGCASGESGDDFSYVLKSNEEIVLESNFNPEFIFTDSNGEGVIEGETYANEDAFYLSVPDIESADKIEFYYNNQIIGESQLTDFGSWPCRI